MAFSVDLINVSPRGDVSLTVDGQHHSVRGGDVLTVTPEAAGEAPRWRRADDADREALAANPNALHTREHAGHLEVYDLGTGLLAQTENWRKPGDVDTEPADPLAPGHPVSADTTGTENS